jgi:hypothetical protein
MKDRSTLAAPEKDLLSLPQPHPIQLYRLQANRKVVAMQLGLQRYVWTVYGPACRFSANCLFKCTNLSDWLQL